jgi:hypothetical protein
MGNVNVNGKRNEHGNWHGQGMRKWTGKGTVTGNVNGKGTEHGMHIHPICTP